MGSDQSLVGVWTSARHREGTAPRRPTIVFLNAGVLHRVGPHRLHVVLARTLAQRGFGGLRLDLSGVGDSRPVPGNRTFRESAVDDTRLVMDELARDGEGDRFVLFGLCSGADNALATAAVDPRVAALVLVDPPAYTTRRARLRALARRVEPLRPGATLRWLSAAAARRAEARLRRVVDRASSRGAEPAEQGRTPPPRAEYGALLERLADRGVRVLSVYSGSLGTSYNAEGQLFEAFPRLRGRVDVAWFADANHVFTERAQQAALVDTVVRWLEGTFR